MSEQPAAAEQVKPARRPWWRRWGRRFLAVVGVAAVAFGLFAWWALTPRAVPVGPETTHVTGPLNDDGTVDFEAALNARLGEGVTPETNAVVKLWQAFGPELPQGQQPPEYYRLLGIEKPSKGESVFQPLGRFLSFETAVSEHDAVLELAGLALHQPWDAALSRPLTDWLRANRSAMALIAEASSRPKYFNPLLAERRRGLRDPLMGTFKLGSLSRFRDWTIHAVRAFCIRAMLRLGAGDPGPAFKDLIVCFRLARLFATGGTFAEAQAGVKIEVYAHWAALACLRHTLGGPPLEAFIQELEALPAFPSLVAKADLTGRLMLLDWIQSHHRRRPVQLASFYSSGINIGERLQNGSIDWGEAFRPCNEWFDRLAAALRPESRADRKRLLRELDAELNATADFFLDDPYWELVTWGGRQDVARERCAAGVKRSVTFAGFAASETDLAEQLYRVRLLAFAVKAYRLERGRYPTRLQDLAAGTLKSIPTDLYTGKPPRYHRDPNGFTVYSVGQNGRDDGGRWQPERPDGFQSADDIAVTFIEEDQP